MIYALVITCLVLAILLSLIVGYHIGKIAREVEIEHIYTIRFLDDLEQACIELGKARWYDIITEKMVEIKARKEKEE